ncbi:MAG TPA: Ig-like domain-containing protein [Pyrinomonadaceae bacterium]|nr:Ig-like domain-containing protein [Pyrinomonadaceae bacterium]
MRIKTKRRLLLIVLSLMTAFASLGALAASASSWTWVPLSNRSQNQKPGKPEQGPSPQPTPVTDNWLPPIAPPAKGPVTREKALAGMETNLLTGGTLTGRMSTPTQPYIANLTTEGTLDWAHWGNGSPTTFNHKINVTQQISNISPIGTGTVMWLADNPSGFTWTDGTPTGSATNVHTGVFLIGVGNGFQITVPADMNLKTLRINLGLWRARGKLEVTLSDGSAGPYIDNSLENQTGTSNGLYTISFAAASAGQTLTVKYTAQQIYHTSGNVTLESATLVNGGDPDQLPIVNISSPADEATFFPGQGTTILANAFDIDGSISSVQFYVDGFLLGSGVLTGSNQYSIPWNTAFAGPHVLTAVATDNEGAKATSDPVNVTALNSTGGGALAGSINLSQTATIVNMGTEGSLDWSHWGFNAPSAFDHKNNVTQQITNMTRIGDSGTGWFVNSSTTFSWADGTPTTSASTASGIVTLQAGAGGNGFEVTAPADTSLKTLKMYIGTWVGRGRFEAALSDGSAPNYVDTSVSSCESGGTFDGIYTLQYKAAAAGQTIRIRFTLLDDCDGTGPFGNVTLRGATLTSSAGNNPPTVSITSPADGTVVDDLQSLTINASASDPDSNLARVEFYANNTKLGVDDTSPMSFTWTSPPSGAYSLTAVAIDTLGAQTTSAPIAIQVNAAPVVDAGYPQSITLPASTTLSGSATDDGLPASPGALTLTWTKTSGPGTVSFGTPNAATTTASFSSEGDYVLRLTASDGNRSSFREVAVGAHPATTINLSPTADAHVRDGSSANTNFGTATTIEVQSSGTTGENRDAYFKFDLSNIGDINNGKLRIFASTSAAGSVTTSVYPVSNTTWTEAAINWNNRPTLGTPALSSVTINGTTFQTYELDVTGYLISEKLAGRNTVTLALHNPSNSTIFVRVNSKEAASNKPQLAISTPETTFVQDKTLGTIRNNLTGWVGMKFTTGAAAVTVTSLGRVYVAGNTGTHTVKLVNVSTGADVAGGSISLNTSTGTPSNGFKYGALAAPVILSANTAYYLVSQETSGGDQWYDSNTLLTTTTIAAVNNAVSRPNNQWVAAGGANNSFGPVDFKYSSSTPSFTQKYHLRFLDSATQGLFQLTTTPPDPPTAIWFSSELKSQPVGEYIIAAFDTQSPVSVKQGFIPTGATTTFTLWMRTVASGGTMFPRAKLNLNSSTGTNICTATGTSALTTTVTKYTLTCVVSSNITVGPTDRYYLWVGVNLTSTSNKSFYPELDFDGTPDGSGDSQLLAALPVVPTITQLSPNVGPTGTTVTIFGANFGGLQGTSTVTFNGEAATVSSWGPNAIVTTVPASAITGPVIVTVNGIASAGVTYTIGIADSDGDGLADAWELFYFGNLSQGANGDPDGDGVNNLQEFLQGRNPTVGTILDPGAINLKLYTPVDP